MAFVEKLITVAETTAVAGRQLKHYDVHLPDVVIEDEVRDAAEAFVARLLAEPDEETPPAGFTVLHRNSQGAFLDAYSWVWTNVIECQTAAAGVPDLGCGDEDPTRFKVLSRPCIGCVWELAPFEHERSAWVRHILEPDTPDLAGYLADTFPPRLAGGPQ